jgi:hypothetical protein
MVAPGHQHVDALWQRQSYQLKEFDAASRPIVGLPDKLR